MAIEKLGQTEEFNIKNFSEEQKKESEVLFDPEKDISEEQWGEIKKSYQIDPRYLYYRTIYGLSQNRAKWLEPLEDVLDRVRAEQKRGSDARLGEIKLTFKALGKNGEAKSVLLNEEFWQKKAKQVKQKIDEGNLDGFVFDTSYLLLADKEQFEKNIRPTFMTFRHLIQQRAEVLRSIMGPIHARFFADLRIVDPELYNNVRLGESELLAVKDRIIKSTNPHDLMFLAEELMILSSEEIKVDQDGLKIISKKPRVDFQESPMPIERKY